MGKRARRRRWRRASTASTSSAPSTELGVDQRWFDVVELTATGYLIDVSDLIKTFGVFPRAEVINIDRARLVGLEALLAVDLFEYVRLSAGGALQDVGRYTQQAPSQRVVGRGELHATLGRLVLSTEWVGGLYVRNYRREPLPDVPLVDAVGELVVPESLLRRPPGLELSLRLEARNLLDRPALWIPGYPGAGRSFFASLAVGYGA